MSTRRRRFKLLAILVGLFAGLGALEVGVRLLGTVDDSGNFFLGSKARALPYALPFGDYAELVRAVQDAETYVAYHPHAGWAIRPSGARGEDLRADAEGFRVSATDTAPVASDALNVLLFGDSFTHGDEVAYEDTWGVALEAGLRRRGISARVRNAGVPAYGMDQAFFRWESLADTVAADLVVFGLQPENLFRNLNVWRPFYSPRGKLPYTKPRLVVEEDGTLRRVNQPATSPEELLELFERGAFTDWAPLRDEAFFDADAYASHWWRASRLLGTLEWLRDPPEATLVEGQAGEPLGLAILEAFQRSCAERGVAFVVVHLPYKQQFLDRVGERGDRHQEFLEAVAARGELLDAYGSLRARYVGGDRDLFMPRNHYTPEANRVVGERLAEELAPLLKRKSALGVDMVGEGE